MPRPAFRGVYTALVTPFRDGRIDEPAFVDLVERQIAAGVQGLVAAGTTGEAPTLSRAERRRLAELCIRTTRGRVPVIVGASANATHEAIALAREAKASGADAALVATPAYIRPSQEGLYQHYRAIAETVDFPILVYNVPARTRVDIDGETLARLSRLPNIIGIKDATGDIAIVSQQRLTCGETWVMLSGDDATMLGYIAEGGQGVISVTANVAPEACVRLAAAALAGDFATGRIWRDRLIGLQKSLFLETSPAPTKFALASMGLCAEDMRLPLMPCAQDVRPQILSALTELGRF